MTRHQLIALAVAAAAVVACSNDDEYSLDYFTQHYGNNNSAGGTENPADTTETVATEADTLYVAIAYNGTTATLTGDTEKVSVSQTGADVAVTSTTDKFLQLTLSGTATDGQLLVYSQRKWGLVLNGVSLANADGPAINNQCGKALYVTLASGTTNTLTDGTTYATQTYDQKGAFFSEGQVYFRGSGELTVNGNARNGIASDDYIVVESGTLSVNVAATGTNGVKANDGFTITGGTLSIDVKADGARGIKCDARTTFSGGTTTIATTGGCKIVDTDGVRDTTSAAGIKSDSLLTVSGGSLAITSTGDGGKGINCSENVEVSGGAVSVITTGGNDTGKPKGVKSLTGIIVSGGAFSVSVRKSWACDNGTDSEDPADRVTIKGTPAATPTLQKRQVLVNF